MYWNSFPRYVSAAEKKAKALKNIAKFTKKNPNLCPVILESTTIAKNWWGKAWNKNLESYADYSNRIGRGRSYVRTNMVIHLQINKNEIFSLVQGSASIPYSVKINIDPLNRKIWQNIVQECQGKIEELDELFAGNFPKLLAETFIKQKTGLFPSPSEIGFYCSCPDGAYMCKHVAATLYGVGARLDVNPALFFELRDVNIGDLITEVIRSKTDELIKKASKKGKRVIDDTNISAIFGIEMEPETQMPVKKGRKKKEN
ncbi:MAG: SWIM zinc finger family protein [bacterium]